MSEATVQAPAAGDVRERVAFEVFAWEHDRRGASAEWICERWQTDSPEWRAKYFDLADRIAALLHAPRGEGAASTPRSGVFWWFGWSGDESHMQPTALYRAEPGKGTRMVAEWRGTRDDAMKLIATLDVGLAALRSEAPGEG